MNKLSGLVLDQYDKDPIGGVTKLASGDLDRLPDNVFALVIRGEGPSMRKFAMADSAHVRESTEAFLANGHRLPPPAQKVAAANLLVGHGWYALEPPEILEKVALGVGTLLTAALEGPGVAKQVKSNLQATKGANGSVMTPQQIHRRGVANRLGT